ncbi:penicillin-insensitive murein endopeptidase [Aliirhizobium smilacinae]|uniref:Penicillin-insensitive murein endopeptidase n=1 Tax=Aliirhizobium smilacinae TaxID=1395944 RepID=A0A5C4XT01_9HYPH|nr:penicillin-insensitive murein endopeptidase [Rhizobium smilacinae]TNM66515.1 penicillin-insensitive murein endopeptidase [Rhizobium smilacinae]
MKSISKMVLGLAATALLCGSLADPSIAQDGTPAKQLFGAVQLPNAASPAPLGFYAKGCMSGAVALPTDGPTWQAMRLSRNRRWGNPAMIDLLEQFSRDAARLGWGSGILVGDISQPRGGPMINGHASHQIGLDADVWFTPKPVQAMTVQQREDMPFTSMLDKSKFLTVDSRKWTGTHARLVMQAASYPQVQRVFVNPAIKKKLCQTWTGDRSLLGKVRPVYGHDEHFHIRMNCPPGAAGCERQAATPVTDDCDSKALAWWFTKEPWAPPKPADPNKKPVKPRQVMLSDLPKACSAVLAGPSRSEAEATYGGEPVAYSSQPAAPAAVGQIDAITSNPANVPADVPVPRERPFR